MSSEMFENPHKEPKPSDIPERSDDSDVHEGKKHEREQMEMPKHAIREYLDALESDMRTRIQEFKEEIEQKKKELKRPEVLPYMREKRLASIREYEGFVSDLERELEEFYAPKNTKEVSTDRGNFRIVYEDHNESNSKIVLKNLDAYAKEAPLSPDSVSNITVPTKPFGGPFDHGVEKMDQTDAHLYAVIRKSDMPVYFCDVFCGGGLKKKILQERFIRFLAESVEIGGSLMFGTQLGFDTIEKIEEDKRKRNEGIYTRRDFLKTVGLGAAAVGLLGTGLYRIGLGMTQVNKNEGSFLRTLEKNGTRSLIV